MTLILKRVHSISIYFSVFVHMIPKRHFATVQIVPEWVHSSFHSEWNSRSGAKFHSGIMSTQQDLRSALLIANRVAISGASGAWSGAKTTRARTSIGAFRFTMWMQNKLHSGTKLIPEWKSFRYHTYKQPLTEATGLMVCNVSPCGCRQSYQIGPTVAETSDFTTKVSKVIALDIECTPWRPLTDCTEIA